MPRGRSRKKAVEAELLPPEESDQPKQKVVEVKHKTEWSELRPVEGVEDAELDLTDDDVEIEKPKRKNKSERDELRKALAQNNITPASQLKLTIERYLHSEHVEGGSWAESEYLTKYTCAREHITSEEYLDVARKFGPGTYRFTLRLQNRIVTAWDKRLGVATTGPTIQHVNPNDPTSPQVIVQMPEGMGAQQPVSVVDPLKQMREAAKFYKEMKQTFEPEGSQPAQPQRSEEEILAGAILKQPEMIENVVGSVIKRFGGSGKGDDEPWYADVVRDAVKSGQLVQVVQVAIDRIFNGVSNLFPGRQNNGQAEMAQAPLQNQQTEQGAQISLIQGQQEGASGGQQNQAGGHGSTELPQGVQNQAQQISPAEQTLAVVIANCVQKTPPQIVADQLLKHADLLNEQAPIYSIDGYLDMFAIMPVDDALEFVKTQPNGEQAASLPHAKEWTTELQRLIREAGQEGEE